MFSIVVPLWNKRHTVAGTVASALAQTWRGFELIIVDDGSTDDGMVEIARFDDLRIRRITQANAGPGAARNAGIRAARHEWIAFLDADDIWMPDHLEELGRIRARFPDAGLIGTSILRSDRKGHYRVPRPKERRIERIDYFESAASGAWPVTTSSAAIPRSTYAALGGFGNARCGQDIEYWARIALDRTIVVSNRATAVYILGTGGISDTVRSPCLGRELRQWGDVHPSLALLSDRRPEAGSPELRGVLNRYVDRQLQRCARDSARIGDLRTLRTLPRLYLRPPPLSDRLLLTLARAPSPVARAGFGLGLRLNALLRFLRLALTLGDPRPHRSSAVDALPIRPGFQLLGNVTPEPLHHIAEQPSR